MTHKLIYSLFVVLFVCLKTTAQITHHNLLVGDSLFEMHNYEEAVHNYSIAANAGDAQAQFNLGYALYTGEGINRDYVSAAQWFKRSAQAGNAKAEYNLAYCYMYGRGVPRNYDLAGELLTKSAEAGFYQAQVTLAECYSKGILFPEDKRLSEFWLAKTNTSSTANTDSSAVVHNDTTPLPSPRHDFDNNGQAPVIKILFPQNNTYFHTRSVKIKYQLINGNGINGTEVHALVNGEQQPIERAVHAAETIDVDVPDEDCTITLYASNENGNSQPVSIHLKREEYQEELPRLFAVAIGVGQYDDPNLPSLKYTCKDAMDFANVLKTKLNYPFAEVQVIALNDSLATRENIHEYMQWMAQEATPTDLCIFYYAGHGYRDERDKFYFMTYGSSINKLYNSFSAQEFRDEAQNINGKLVVFTDACYSAQLGMRSAQSDFVKQLRSARKGMLLFASSAADTKSKEDDKWQNGAFTKALVEAFNGAARTDGDIGLSTHTLDTFLYNEVRRLTDKRQTPIFTNPDGIEHFNLFLYE